MRRGRLPLIDSEHTDDPCGCVYVEERVEPAEMMGSEKDDLYYKDGLMRRFSQKAEPGRGQYLCNLCVW